MSKLPKIQDEMIKQNNKKILDLGYVFCGSLKTLVSLREEYSKTHKESTANVFEIGTEETIKTLTKLIILINRMHIDCDDMDEE